MNIKIENYILEQEVNSPTKFNLFVIRKAGDKAKNPGEEKQECVAYGVSLQRAIELIASYELLDSDETVSLREYVSLFNEQLKRFDKLLENI